MADGLLNKASIILTPTGYKAGTLYNVAPVVEPYEDFDFARASVASRVNSSGLVEMVGRTLGSELVTNGDFATDSDWNKGSGWSISGGEAISIGGANFASLNQEIGATSGKTYKVIFTISEYTSGQLFLNIQGSSITYTSAETFTAYVVAGGSRLYFVSGSGSNQFIGKIDNVSVKEIIDTNNIPRISYDSNGDNGHILLEPTSTNLVTYSEDFSEWTNVSATLTPNQSSPDGSDNAYIVEDDNPSSFERVDETITTVASSHTFSVFIKKKTSAVSSYGGIQMGTGFSYVIFDSYNGTYNQQSNTNYDSIEVENFSSDWWRLKLTATLTTSTRVALWGAISTNGTSISTSATGSETFYGAQLEALSYATSYIPTLTGSTVTRATETATGAGSADLINSTEGVLYAEIAALANDGLKKYISLSDGTTSNDVRLYFDTSDRISVLSKVGGATQVFLNTTDYTLTNYNKIAFKYKVNDFALWINGTEVATDNSGSVNSANTLNQLNFNGNNLDFFGKCKALAVFNEALSDSELTQLTT